ncbi:MAG: hypothetical protein R2706_09535 [Acidimicrobiales bacterium]
MPSSATYGTIFTGGLAAASNPDDTNTANDSGTSSVTAGPEVSDLATTVSDPGPVVPGVSTIVVITTTNNGSSDASNTTPSLHPTRRREHRLWTTCRPNVRSIPTMQRQSNVYLAPLRTEQPDRFRIPVIVSSDASPSATLGGVLRALRPTATTRRRRSSADLTTDAAAVMSPFRSMPTPRRAARPAA